MLCRVLRIRDRTSRHPSTRVDPFGKKPGTLNRKRSWCGFFDTDGEGAVAAAAYERDVGGGLELLEGGGMLEGNGTEGCDGVNGLVAE